MVIKSQSYQIRSKIKLKPVEGVNLEDVKDEIEKDIVDLFCVDPRFKIAEAQECELTNAGNMTSRLTKRTLINCLSDYNIAVPDESELSGDVQFLVQVLLPQNWTKKDLKGHCDEGVKELTTTTSTTTTTTPTNTETTTKLTETTSTQITTASTTVSTTKTSTESTTKR